MTYVLIILMFVASGYASAGGPVGIAFDNKEACEKARDEVLRRFSTGMKRNDMNSTAFCIPKA